MNGTITEESCAPWTMGALAPRRIVAPVSVPGRSALGIALMQCMHFTQLLSSISSSLPSHSMHLVGQFPQTSRSMFIPPSA